VHQVDRPLTASGATVCPLWVISEQTVASEKRTFVCFGPKADKRGGGWNVR